MGLTDLLHRRARTVAERRHHSEDLDPRSAAGVIAAKADDRLYGVTSREALTIPAAYRAVALISTTVAQLGADSYRDGVTVDEPPRVVTRPNPWTTRYEFINATVLSLALRGNAYWWTTGEVDGRPTVAVPISPDELTVEWVDDRRLRRRYRWRGRYHSEEEIRHIAINRAPGALLGLSPLEQNAQSLGGMLTAEEWAAQLYTSGAVPDGVIESPGPMTKAEAERVRDQFATAHIGIRQPAVLSGGLKYHALTFSPRDLAYLDARVADVGTVARIWGIPGHLLGWAPGGSSLTYQNLEQVSIEFVRYTLAPGYLAPIEEVWSDLVPRTQVVRFDVAELLRGDITTRYNAYATGISNAFLDPTEVRRIEGMDPTVGAETGVPPHLDPLPRRTNVSEGEVPADAAGASAIPYPQNR